MLCERFGGKLSNRYRYPVGSDGFDMIGEQLTQLGVQLDPAADLAFAGG
ncbi:hypothetical protein IU459_36345 [Nocardia amamiensis]|uniref:Uncharacterized protein n=1 Tax=Nocardia amamiensis TaxID=404578 RepID=A0ABS0D2C4_9NOCA|nr:hypothetical protein [Nocardia amamiensis]